MSSQLRQDNSTANTLNNTAFIVSAGFLTISLLLFQQNFPDYFLFHFNKYALFSAFNVLANTGLLIILVMRRGNSLARMWFSVTVIGNVMLGLGEMLERLSNNPQQALFWSHLSILGIVLIPVGLYMFVHYFIGRTVTQSDVLLPAFLICSGLLLALQTLNVESLSLIYQTRGHWGFGIPQSQPFLVLILWLGTIIILGLFRFVQYYRSLTERKLRQQTLVIIGGISFAVLAGIGGDVIPHYTGHNIFPVGVLLQTVTVATVIYAIHRYNTFSVDLSQIAGDILNSLAEAVVVTDTSFNIQSANRMALQFSAYNKDTLLTQPISCLFGETQSQLLMKKINQSLIDTNIAQMGEMNLIDRLGKKLAVNVSVAKLEGDIPAYLFAISDISQLKSFFGQETKRNEELEKANDAFRNQQKAMVNLLEDSRDLGEQLQREKANVELKVDERTAELRAERARLEASINSLNIGFIIVDDQKKIITANRAFSQILDNNDDHSDPQLELLSSSLKDTFDVSKSIDTCFKTAKNINENNLQFGSKVLRIFMAPIFESSESHKPLGAVILVEDISEAKAVERSRDEFFSIASHELRTPLTAIRGNTQMIREYYKEAISDPSLSEMIDDIHDSSIRLISIVNDFLDTSRLEQGKITFKLTDFDVKDLAEEVAHEFKIGEVSPNLYIKIRTQKTKLPLVRADRDRLKQTVINLVGNSLKFTDTGGVIVHLHNTAKVVYIDVTDTGKGIPLESQNLLFRKFQQASNNILTRDFTRSTGLGLYISRLMIEGMAGKIYLASSEVDKGSTFTVEMPVATAKDSATKT